MKNAAFALVLLLVGCLPANNQEIIQQPPNLKYLLDSSVPGVYTTYLYSSEPAVIRRQVLQAEGLSVADDPSCVPWEPLPGSLSCGKGVTIRAAPGGYRLNLTAREQPVGTACVVQGDVIELLLCADLEPLPSF